MRGKAFALCLIFLLGLSQPLYSEFSSSELHEIRINESGSSTTQTTLAYEWLSQHGGSEEYTINKIITDSFGDIFAVGTTDKLSSNSTFGLCEFTKNMVFFVMKLQTNGQCLWVSDVTVTNQGNMASGWTMSSIDLDSNGNLFATGWLTGAQNGQSKTFEFESNITFKPSTDTYARGFIGKLNGNGVWQWVSVIGSEGLEVTDVAVNSLDEIYISGHETTTTTSSTGFSSYRPFISKMNQDGTTNWTEYVEPGADNNSNPGLSSFRYMKFNDIDINLANEISVIGTYGDYRAGGSYSSYDFDNYNLQPTTDGAGDSMFIAKMNRTGSWLGVDAWNYSENVNRGHSVSSDSNGNVLITGISYGQINAGNYSIDSGSNENAFIAKLNSSGGWDWLISIQCSCSTISNQIVVDSNDDIWIAGGYYSSFQIGSLSLSTATGGEDAFVAKLSSNGTGIFALGGGSANNEEATSFALDSAGIAYLAGQVGTGTSSFGVLGVQNSGGKDWFVTKLTRDYDGDLKPDSTDDDDDGDFVFDILDQCQYSPIGFESVAALDHDSDGCRDSDEDDDDDNDGLLDGNDSCPRGMTGWTSSNLTDLDNDGCLDALEDYDDDADGFEDFEDYCPRIPGNSTFQYEQGCPDSDGDGRADILDMFPDDPQEWEDSDNDGYGNNIDSFPLDATQNKDTDGDGYGDFTYGNGGDGCPFVAGNSSIDLRGCPDSDGDGYSDQGDDFPYDKNEHLDTDKDGVPDHSDAFPFDPTQQTDSDGDGYGDNQTGNNPDLFPDDPSKYFDSDRDGIDDTTDAFPFDPTQWEDSDGDGYGDNQTGNNPDLFPDDPSKYFDSDRDGHDDSTDAFPFDPTQWEDDDGDGMGDNPMGIGADKFPSDPTQWGDIDGDGYGDNQTGNNPDAFPTDATQWSDIDGDGYGDNPSGRLYDQFPNNPTQWIDEDGDGLGDNENGTNADPYLNDFDNDGFNDTIDILPRFASPGDLDADGCLDFEDAFPTNALECLDTDGDGTGDNSDSDDDNDGWTDADEERLGTDPLDDSDSPIDSFEIVIPGTAVGLGAWDLIGIFGGVPIFSWLAFGFVTRNKRCARFEEDLSKAESRQELEEIALRWEFSLMLRLLGPHQGIRLERIRSELDDEFENAENMMISQGITPMTAIDQTPLVEEFSKETPEEFATPKRTAKPDQTDEFGYQWIKHNGEDWYRGSNDEEWSKLEE